MKHSLVNQRVLIFGLGVSGEASLRVLTNLGIVCLGLDRDLAKVKLLKKKYPQAELKTEEQYQVNDFQPDIVIKSPGISFEHPQVHQLRQNNIPIVSDIDFFSQWVDIPIIAITGSNGKSTLCHILSFALKELNCPHFLGGNFGRPIAEYYESDNSNQYIILEVSSFQAEVLKYLRPMLSVIINLYPHHLERHPDFKHYILSKLNLVKNISKDGGYLLTSQVEKCLRQQNLDNNFNNKINMPKTGQFNFKQCKLPGQHNIENFQLAYSILKYFYFNNLDQTFQTVINTIKGLKHRLEYIKSINGIQVFNDSKSTNLVSLETAIKSFAGKNLSVIIGGQLRTDDLADYEIINQYQNIKKVYLIGDSSEKLSLIIKHPQTTVQSLKSLKKVIEKDFIKNDDIDCLVFSPGFPSYDMFENFIHRGESFSQMVETINLH